MIYQINCYIHRYSKLVHFSDGSFDLTTTAHDSAVSQTSRNKFFTKKDARNSCGKHIFEKEGRT